MLRILLVEDDPDKREAIQRAISDVEELPPDTIVVAVRTASEARNALAGSRFDVAVLDIALPRNESSEIDPDAGVSILDDLVGRPNAFYIPTHIIGLTGYADVLTRARGRFASFLLTLTLYDPARTEW